MTQVIPHLNCRNAKEAIEFYCRAFGATNMGIMEGPDGKVMHGAILIDGAPVYFCDEFLDWGAQSPQSLGGTPVTIHVQVEDAEALFNKATAAGCEVKMPLELAFWGHKYGVLKDPYGHMWSIAQEVEQKSPEEMKAAMDAAMINGPECQANG